MVVPSVLTRGVGLSRTHASGRWLGTKQAGVCAVGYMSSPKGETFREECEPTLPQGSPKGDMSGSEHPRDSPNKSPKKDLKLLKLFL
jgi:hypothetical protein